jgi:hypothetical protein
MAKNKSASVARKKNDHDGAKAVHGEQKPMHAAASKSASRLALGANMVQGKGVNGKNGDAKDAGDTTRIMRQGNTKRYKSPVGMLRKIMGQ